MRLGRLWASRGRQRRLERQARGIERQPGLEDERIDVVLALEALAAPAEPLEKPRRADDRSGGPCGATPR